jgi:HEAT repeat protein
MASVSDRLAPILALLRSADVQERRDGILELVRSGDPMTEAILARLAATDPSVEIRYYARRALDSLTSRTGTTGEEQPIPDRPVPELLIDPDPRVRFAGIRRALAQGGPLMVELLRAGLQREQVPQLTAGFITALGRLGGADDLALLAPYLQNSEPRLRANAVEAMATIGTETAYSCLIPLLQDDDNRVKANVLKALQAYGGAPLFQLLRRMALEGEVWMRDSALYALTQFKAPQALLVIGRMATHDPLDRLRLKARTVLERLADQGNQGAVDLLRELGLTGGPTAAEEPAPQPVPEPSPAREPIVPAAPVAEDGVPPAGRPSPVVEPAHPRETDRGGQEERKPDAGLPDLASLEQSHIFAADDSDLPALLAHDDPAHRQLGVVRLGRRNLPEDAPILIKALAYEQEPFLLAALVAIARNVKVPELFPVLVPLLKHADDRVRANAVEALAAIDLAGSSGHLLELIDDPNNRVRGNVILALTQDGVIDPLDALRKMAQDSREYWRRTTLYVISSLRDAAFVPLLEQLLEDVEQKVRDVAFEVVKEFALAGVPGAKDLQGRMMARIRLERSRNNFFENSFDQMFSGVIEAVRADQADSSRHPYANPDRERAALCALARKPAAHNLVPAVFFNEMNRVKAELERLDGVVREAERLAIEVEGISLEAGVKARAEVELLRLQRKRLVARQDAILAEAGAKVLEKARGLPAGSRLALNPELEKAAMSLTEHVPLRAFSVLPDDEANVPELFDLTMRVYQKHVMPFSGVSLLAGALFLGLLAAEIFFGAVCFGINPIVGALAVLPLMLVAGIQYLVILSIWKIQITIMMSHYVQGRSPSFKEVLDEGLPMLLPLILTNFKRYLFLGGWLFAASCAALPLVGVAEALEGMVYLKALLKLSAIILFVVIFGQRYFPYLLVEPSFILTRGKNENPFDWALQAFGRAPFRLIFLHVFATFMMGLISGTTQELLVFTTVIPAGQVFVVAITLLSEMCLAPMVYSTLVIFAMLRQREEGSTAF